MRFQLRELCINYYGINGGYMKKELINKRFLERKKNGWKLRDSFYSNDRIIRSDDEYERIMEKIIRGDKFVLLRYGDGEAKIIKKENVLFDDNFR